MKPMRPVLVIPAVLAAGSIFAATSHPITLAYKVPKKPSLARPAIPQSLLAGPVHVEVVDARGGDDPAIVGEQREKENVLYVWRAKNAVPAAVGGFVTTILEAWGITAGDGGVTLAVKLERYWVEEKSVTFGSNYQAEVRLSASLVGPSGETSWTHVGDGKAGDSAVDGRESACNGLLGTALYQALTEAIGTQGEPGPAASAPQPIEPQAMYDELVRLKGGGVGEDVLAAYVKQRRLSRPLSVDEILAWKNAGIPDAVIKLASP